MQFGNPCQKSNVQKEPIFTFFYTIQIIKKKSQSYEQKYF
jgi:hypothetical protein